MHGGHVVLDGIVQLELESYEDAITLYMRSIEGRKQAATNFNEQSSRSHLVFSVIVEHFDMIANETTKGKISLVDLAGSENLKHENNNLRKGEGIKVNQSLNALKNVISCLVDKAKHIPYNDNLLTKLMRDSLGGDSKTLVIVCISPAASSFEQSKNSLLWATNMKQVKNRPKQHKDHEKTLRMLEQEKSQNEALQEYIRQLEEKINELERAQMGSSQAQTTIRNNDPSRTMNTNSATMVSDLFKNKDKTNPSFSSFMD